MRVTAVVHEQLIEDRGRRAGHPFELRRVGREHLPAGEAEHVPVDDALRAQVFGLG